MTTIEKIEKGIITLAEFTEGQQSFIRGIVKLSFNEGQEQALRIHDVVGQSEQLSCYTCIFYTHSYSEGYPCATCRNFNKHQAT
jgi:hypothetical protein